MIERYDPTEIFAVFIGLYFVASGAALLLDRDFYRQVLSGLYENSALGFVTGLVTFLIGATIVALDNSWDSVLAVVVSLVGWAALLEGMALIAVRRRFLGLVNRFRLGGTLLDVITIATMAVGALLVIVGLS